MASHTNPLDTVGPMDAELRMILGAFKSIQQFESNIALSESMGDAFWVPGASEGQPERRKVAMTEYYAARNALINCLFFALQELDLKYFKREVIGLESMPEHAKHFVKRLIQPLETKILARRGGNPDATEVDMVKLDVAYAFAERLFTGAITFQIKARELEEVSDFGKMLTVEERLARRMEEEMARIDQEERMEEKQRRFLEAQEDMRRKRERHMQLRQAAYASA